MTLSSDQLAAVIGGASSCQPGEHPLTWSGAIANRGRNAADAIGVFNAKNRALVEVPNNNLSLDEYKAQLDGIYYNPRPTTPGACVK